MPETPIVYDDVEVVDHDDLGFSCVISGTRAFIGKYVPLDGTTVRRRGDHGRLALPRWFVEEQGLPLNDRLSDADLEAWKARARLKAVTAQEYAAAHPEDREAGDALDRAVNDLTHAMLLRARRQGPR